jgi:hypothetical protein
VSSGRDVTLIVRLCVTETDTMSQQKVDAYLAALEEPKQSTLRTLRQTILETLPDAEQCISYAIPGFRVRGQMIAGFAAFKNHLSYFPHSGPRDTGAPRRRWSIHDEQRHTPVSDRHAASKALVEKLVIGRMRQAFPEGGP